MGLSIFTYIYHIFLAILNIFIYIYTYFHVYFYIFSCIFLLISTYLPQKCGILPQFSTKVWYYCTTIVCCFTNIYLDYSTQSTYFYLYLPIFTTYFYIF